MPDADPPPDTFDHKAAYEWAERMRDRADSYPYWKNGGYTRHLWGEWALVEAYIAGRAAALAERAKVPAEWEGE